MSNDRELLELMEKAVTEHPGYSDFAEWCESQSIHPHKIYFLVWMASREALVVEKDQLRADLQIADQACMLSIAERHKLRAEVEALRKDVSSLRGSCKALGDENKHLARRAKQLAKAVTWFSGLHIGVMKPKWLLSILAKEGSANG